MVKCFATVIRYEQSVTLSNCSESIPQSLNCIHSKRFRDCPDFGVDAIEGRRLLLERTGRSACACL